MLVRVRPALRGSLLLAFALALVAGAPVVAAQEEEPAPPNDQSKPGASKRRDATRWKKGEPVETTIDSFGAFNHRSPIEVPSFRGITPRLSLDYESSGSNGRAGVGWSLEGGGRIERAGQGRGAPHYDASDIYLLNGEELVPCAAGSVSPSCTSGGTHSTRTEDFSRIAYTGAGADSRWTITAKDGTRRVHAPVYLVGSGNVYRWGLTQVIDTSGNAVTYTWGENQLGCCWEYLDSISYNGTTIELHYEARPDKESAAIGAGALTTIHGRLKTIDVKVSGVRVRAYQLTYARSGATSRSLLATVRQFGKDAALDASGTVTGGTSLPAITVGYRAGSPSFVQGDADWSVGNNSSARYFAMDINGDGKTDMLELFPSFLAMGRRTWLSTGSGFTLASTASGGIANSSDSRFLPMDVNADGREDFVELYPATFSWGRRTWISSGTGFSLGGQDTSAGPRSDESRFFAMEIDGDGKTDMLELYVSWGSYRRATWISTGTGFTLASNHTGISASNRQFFPADVNGDGRSDLLELHPVLFGSGSRRIWLSTGTGFVAGATDTITISSGSRFLTMDVNGDGKTDMVDLNPFFGSYTRKTWLSTGYGFALASSDSMPASTGSRHLTFDVNGDQREDLIELYPAFLVFQRRIWLSTGSGFAQGAGDTGMVQSSGSQIVPMDVNGDGLTEMVDLYPSGFTMRRTIWRVDGSVPDLVMSLTDEQGGATTVSYTPSSAWANTNGPPVVQSTTEVTVADGRGAAATTTYRYAGGFYDHAAQRFQGFRYQEETRPCVAGESACPTTETWFRQDNGAATLPERVDERSGEGRLLRSNLHEYTTNGATRPWVALPSGRWEYTYVGTGAACPGAECKRTYQVRTFNAHGEVTLSVDHGDYDATGDEETMATVFVPNTTAYIVNKPADVKTFDGVGTSGALLTETLDYFDGATTWNQAPTRGLVTRTARWLSSPSSFVESATEYDTRGNVTARVNALGARTTYVFDPVYYLYPTAETNPLDQVTSTTWDAACGEPTRTTDRNDQVTTMTHDALCRLSEKTEPGGKFERHTWVSLGDASAQHVLTERPPADGTAAPLWTRTYFDGRGRTWRTVSKGPDAATGDVHVDTTYDDRGQEASKTAPYYWVAGTAKPATHTTTRAHDALDRLTLVTYPDGKHQTTSHGLWSTTVTDELGRAMTDRMDAKGRRVAHEETIDGAVRTVTYAHDPRGHLARSTDPLGNVVTYSTDSLGRMTSMLDPDWGPWTYEHDGAGRLIAQTDAKGQRTEMAHDALDRMIEKTSLAGTASPVTVTWTHDEVRPGYHNVGRLTTMTDGAGQKTFDHDAAGRVVKATRTIGGTSYTFQHGFDPDGRPQWTTYPDGDTLGTPASPLRYDGAGQLASIPGYVTAAHYNAEGKLTRIESANGTVTTRPHDPQRGWLTAISTTSGAATIQALAYTRNDKGMVTQVTSPFADEGWTYGYDELDRLTAATSASSPANDQTLTYDAIGNITSSSRLGAYRYDAAGPHAVTAAGPNTYAYDAAGLMISGPDRTLTWNGDNRLASVTTGATALTFTYDADGARIQQVDGGVTRRYLGHDFELRVPGPATKYVSVAGTLVARAEGATRHWVHTDHLGSIQAETNAAGVEVHRKKYRPYGEILSTAGSLPYEPRGYTAQRHDASGLVYLHARYHDPQLGRFISPDVVIDGPDLVGLNRYAYAGNDPINHTDIIGLCKGGNSKGPSTAQRCKRLAAQAAKKLAGAAAVAAIMMGSGSSTDTSATMNVIEEMQKIAETASDVMKDREEKFTIKRGPQGPTYSYPKPGPTPPAVKPPALPAAKPNLLGKLGTGLKLLRVTPMGLVSGLLIDTIVNGETTPYNPAERPFSVFPNPGMGDPSWGDAYRPPGYQ